MCIRDSPSPSLSFQNLGPLHEGRPVVRSVFFLGIRQLPPPVGKGRSCLPRCCSCLLYTSRCVEETAVVLCPCIASRAPMRERIWAASFVPPTGEKTGDFPPVFIQFWVPPAGHKKTPQVCVTYGVWDRKRVLTFHISTLCPASIKFLTSHRVPCL